MERKNETVTRERIEKLSTEDICEIQRNGSIANADEKDQVEAKKCSAAQKEKSLKPCPCIGEAVVRHRWEYDP